MTVLQVIVLLICAKSSQHGNRNIAMNIIFLLIWFLSATGAPRHLNITMAFRVIELHVWRPRNTQHHLLERASTSRRSETLVETQWGLWKAQEPMYNNKRSRRM